MHGAQRKFFEIVKKHLPDAFEWASVLEIGSLNINGTIRDFYNNCAFTGVDVGAGDCVDIVAFGENLKFRDSTFDSIVSSELMEHCQNWQRVFENMIRMSKPGGVVVMTCAGPNRPEHGTTRSDIDSSPLTVAAGIEYYENRAGADFLPFAHKFCGYVIVDNKENYDTYLIGVVGTYSEPKVKTAISGIGQDIHDWLGENGPFLSYPHRQSQLCDGWRDLG